MGLSAKNMGLSAKNMGLSAKNMGLSAKSINIFRYLCYYNNRFVCIKRYYE